jgi:protein arginine kinase activator
MAMLKCQKCPKTATLHITEILGEEQIEELHFCEECAHRFLYEQSAKNAPGKNPSATGIQEEPEEQAVLNRECEVCGIKFIDFRNTGRLGCPHDYDAFRDELMPLLENIHGETRHCGKAPRRQPEKQRREAELTQLRKMLLQAINKEAYEEAAQLRDSIRRMEEG